MNHDENLTFKNNIFSVVTSLTTKKSQLQSHFSPEETQLQSDLQLEKYLSCNPIYNCKKVSGEPHLRLNEKQPIRSPSKDHTKKKHSSKWIYRKNTQKNPT